MKKEMTLSVAGVNVILAFCLLVSVTTATIQITNYPNPFSPKTTTTKIAFYVSDQAQVSAVIYDLLGNEVKTVTNAEFEAGEYTIPWNGKNEEGDRVAKGGYILRLTIRYKDGKTEYAVRKIGVL